MFGVMDLLNVSIETYVTLLICVDFVFVIKMILIIIKKTLSLCLNLIFHHLPS